MQRSTDNKPGGRDLIGHSSIQAWSAGPLFPAVIAQVENYATYEEFLRGRIGQIPMTEEEFYAQPLEARFNWVAFELIYPGRKPALYATYADAERVARYYKALDAADKVVGETGDAG